MSLPPVPSYPIVTDHVTVEIRADRAHPGGRLLLMDGVEASHVDLEDPTRIEFEYLRHLVGVIEGMFPPRDTLDALQVGGGPCTLARYLTATRRRARVRVVERDGGIVAVAREHLGLVTGPRLVVDVGDGREAIAALPDASLDLVVIDAFVGIVAPHRLSTAEFITDVRRVLRPGGLHAMNLIDVAPLELARAVVVGMLAEYPEVALVADPAVLAHRTPGNVVLLASDRSLPAEGLGRGLSRDHDPWQARTGRALARMVSTDAPLRDDEQPVHELARLAPLWGRTQQH